MEFLARLSVADADHWTDRLLAEFGSLGSVMSQSLEAQARASGSRDAAEFLQTGAELTRRWLRERAAAGPIMHDTPDVLAYLRVQHAFEPDECLRVLFLSLRLALLNDELLWRGSIDQAPFWSRVVLRRCLELNAASIIVVHNHPSGDHDPSKMDIETTVRFIEQARSLDVIVHDHLIFSSTGHSSLRAMGLI